MNGFNDLILDCSFIEIPFTGPPMTWMRGSSSNKILERLDRGLMNSAFLNYFPNILEVHVTRDSSDHLPLLFTLHGHQFSSVVRKKQF